MRGFGLLQTTKSDAPVLIRQNISSLTYVATADVQTRHITIESRLMNMARKRCHKRLDSRHHIDFQCPKRTEMPQEHILDCRFTREADRRLEEAFQYNGGQRCISVPVRWL